MLSEVSCLSLAAVPPGEQRSRFLAVGLADSTVRIISLDPTVSVSICLSVLCACLCAVCGYVVCVSLCCLCVYLYTYLCVIFVSVCTYVCVNVCMDAWVIRYVICIHMRGWLCLVCVFKCVGRCGCMWYK